PSTHELSPLSLHDALPICLAGLDYAVLVTAEAKSIPLIHALSVVTGKPYVVLRKFYKSYMGDALSATTHSITTGEEQTLYLDGKDRKSTRLLQSRFDLVCR